MHHCCLLSRTILPDREIGHDWTTRAKDAPEASPTSICNKKRQETSKKYIKKSCVSMFIIGFSMPFPPCFALFAWPQPCLRPQRKGRREAGWTSAPWVVPLSSSSRSAARSRGNAAMASKIRCDWTTQVDPSGMISGMGNTWTPTKAHEYSVTHGGIQSDI